MMTEAKAIAILGAAVVRMDIMSRAASDLSREMAPLGKTTQVGELWDVLRQLADCASKMEIAVMRMHESLEEQVNLISSPSE